MHLLQNEFTLLWHMLSTNIGWMIGVLIYTGSLVYDRRRLDKQLTQNWCNSTNPKVLQLFYPTWFETIRGMFPGYLFKLAMFIVIYFYVSRLIDNVIH